MTRVSRTWFDRSYDGRVAFVDAHLPTGPITLLGVGNIGSHGFSSWDRIGAAVRACGGTAVGCDLAATSPSPDQVQGDLTRLPFVAGAFDAVYLGEVVEHLWEPRTGLCEARRVLAPGGLLVLDTPNSLSVGTMIDWALRHVDDLGDPDHKQAFTPASLLGLIEAAGFAVDEMATDRKLSVGRYTLPWVPGWRRLGAHLLVRARAV
jgi:SAM-dependent methyltransferase